MTKKKPMGIDFGTLRVITHNGCTGYGHLERKEEDGKLIAWAIKDWLAGLNNKAYCIALHTGKLEAFEVGAHPTTRELTAKEKKALKRYAEDFADRVADAKKEIEAAYACGKLDHLF